MHAFHERVAQLVRTWQPDIVQLEFHVMGQYLSALNGSPVPRVLNQHEPGALAARHVWERSRGAGRLHAYLDLRAWQRYESLLVQQVNAIVVFTEQDSATMASYTAHPPIITIPFGTVPPARALDPAGQLPPMVLFVGNFRHPPNADAAVRLARDIFPMVRQQHPEAMLYIVGAHAPTVLRKRPDPNVVITDFVSDLTAYMDRAAVVVAPLGQGGGMRVKVLEALAAGKAVVASSLAAAGLGVSHGDQLLLAESDQQFSREIVRLLGDQEEREALAGRARRWALSELTWERPLQAYVALFRDLTARAHLAE
jgi:glycosyltransferase involved in cell wall biosynthesis